MKRKAFQRYLHKLEELVSRASLDIDAYQSDLEIATNGQAKSEVIATVTLKERRKNGIFFTDASIARLAARYLKKDLQNGATVLDPTCGAGDLLIACAEHLATATTPRKTVGNWQRVLFGIDCYPEFVEATRKRLLLKCLQETQKNCRVSLRSEKYFQRICQGNVLEKANVPLLSEVDVVVTNPPFQLIQTPAGVEWSSGLVNAAAVFIDQFLTQMKTGAKLVAILPDVLRSGSRYRKWREELLKRLRVNQVHVLEKFDPKTDVHVFILTGVKTHLQTQMEKNVFATGSLAQRTVSDFFQVSVGPVVDYRSPKKGNWLPYLVARNLPTGSLSKETTNNRRFNGKRFKAPFVLLKRTSRPSTAMRLQATLVPGIKEYAIENHLIVLKPRDGKLKSCQMAIDILESSATTDFLNSTIRCRHLTTGAIKSIPWKRSALVRAA